MKKLLLLMVLAFALSANCYAQVFELSPDGIRNAKDTAKRYVVIDFPGLTQQDLFSKTKSFITQSYVSPKDVMSESSPDVISVNGYKAVNFLVGGIPARRDCDLRYTIKFAFKDNKVRVEFQVIKFSVTHTNGHTVEIPIRYLGGLSTTNGVYKRNGELRDERAKAEIENIPNSMIDGLKKHITTPVDDNW